ncbi:MAG TPA: hypothetical protein VNU27_11625 [Candidatus Acidoferrum sp.]|nr:hypothetical protein [Candidatus Acidoferrum sp.]
MAPVVAAPSTSKLERVSREAPRHDEGAGHVVEGHAVMTRLGRRAALRTSSPGGSLGTIGGYGPGSSFYWPRVS